MQQDLKSIGINAYFLAVTTNSLEFYLAVDHCKKCIIRTLSNACSGMDMSASLSYDNITCKNVLSVSSLYTKTFRFGISSVLGGAHTFFMCHLKYTSSTENNFVFTP